MREGWHSKRRGEVERRREGSGGETDSRRNRVAFGEDRRSDKIGRERVPEAVIKKEGRWSSDAFMVYVTANV